MEKEKLVKLVVEAQNGDSKSMNQLFNAFYNDVYYFALKTVKNEDTACDITQETFVEIIKTIKNLQEPAAFVTWMKQITYHQCTRYFKKKKDVLVEEDEDGNTVFDTLVEDRAEFIPDEALGEKKFKETVLEIIDGLTEEQRSAIMMYYFEELTVKEIAEIQGVSEGTVKSRLNYGRKAIKSAVEEYEEKNGIKLHAIPFFPLFKLLFKDDATRKMAGKSAKLVAKSVTSSTGTSIQVATGVGAKIVAMPVMAKVTAGILALTVTVSCVAGVALSKNNKDDNVSGDNGVVETAQADASGDNQENKEGETEAPKKELTEEDIKKQLVGCTDNYEVLGFFNSPSEISDSVALQFLFRKYGYSTESEEIVEKLIAPDNTVYEYVKNKYTISLSDFEEWSQKTFGRSFDFSVADGFFTQYNWEFEDYSYDAAAKTISVMVSPMNAGDIAYPEETLYDLEKIGENTYKLKISYYSYYSSAPDDASRIYKECPAHPNGGYSAGYLCLNSVTEKTFTLVDGNWRYDSYVSVLQY